MKDFRCWVAVAFAIFVSSMAGCEAICEWQEQKTKRKMIECGYIQQWKEINGRFVHQWEKMENDN